jgi:hypothetical protein
VNSGMLGSNPTRKMGTLMRFCLVCCSVQIMTLRCTDPPSRQSESFVVCEVEREL